MYRQILIHPDDADLQRIVWRASPEQDIQAFRLLTVTYGTAAAPYLALRVLKQLAIDEQATYPVGSNILQNDFYVDDVLSGAQDIATADNARQELSKLLAAGGFHLRKWASNYPELLATVAADQHSLAADHPLMEDENIKVLGLAWNPTTDSFRFQVALPAVTAVHTKRSVLSVTARLYDPLGWLTPVVIVAKILMQELWLCGIGWDDPLPAHLQTRWIQYCHDLPCLQDVSVNRSTGQHSSQLGCELHGFADASSHAYAAVVYLRVVHDFNDAQVTILLAKSKVAPIKQLSIPRLELCAAALLAQSIEVIQRTMELEEAPVYAWTDSAVVLAWLRNHSSRWQTFIANRVSDIQTRLPTARWDHVSTLENPADCASRGLTPDQLIEHPLWWHGPSWLSSHSTGWPHTIGVIDPEVDFEERPNPTVHLVRQDDNSWDLAKRFSSWPRLLRVTAYCLRFGRNLQSAPQQRLTTPLTAEEVHLARRFWIRQAQQTAFQQEQVALQQHISLPKRSPLLRLNPFRDEHGIIRVGGRLRHSLLTYDEKHPVVLPRHRISDLIVAHAHIVALHGGPQLTLRIIRQQYWMLGGRNLVRSHIHRCVSCIREQGRGCTQMMSDLPRSRTAPTRPFHHTGVDYAGPILVRMSKGRGYKANKAYVALFICFTTRAIHLELVSDYTSPGFIAALHRFVSRRGIPVAIYSDNGTTFQGADKELQRAFRIVTRDPDLAAQLASDGTTWHFLPPAAPHFGGLWEAGVKAMKHHLRRIVGSHTLTFEELTTFLTQVEACLNSRPLGPFTDDPNDFAALTPGHFLIGAPITTVPEPSLLDLNVDRLSCWQLVRHLYEQLWKRWSTEYLHTLQQRHKWNSTTPDIQRHELVLVRDNLLPPAKWQLARVLDCHPGPDGKVRVVTIRTATSTLMRPIAKLCPLLIRPAAEPRVADPAGP